MSNEDIRDVVVVGGGLGGLSTAVRAAQLGLRVTVLERGEEELYLCNSRFSGGILHIAQHNVLEPAEQLEQVILEATLGEADPALARTLALDARRAVGWLAEAGTRFIKVGQIVWQQHVLAPPRPITPGLDWKGRGPDVTLRVLEAQLTKAGGSILRGTAACSLMESGGRCIGVEAQSRDGKAPAVSRARGRARRWRLPGEPADDRRAHHPCTGQAQAAWRCNRCRRWHAHGPGARRRSQSVERLLWPHAVARLVHQRQGLALSAA
jgi:succinate dehydrogenase/fumarate reductase flavoprotein subunit